MKYYIILICFCVAAPTFAEDTYQSISAAQPDAATTAEFVAYFRAARKCHQLPRADRIEACLSSNAKPSRYKKLFQIDSFRRAVVSEKKPSLKEIFRRDHKSDDSVLAACFEQSIHSKAVNAFSLCYDQAMERAENLAKAKVLEAGANVVKERQPLKRPAASPLSTEKETSLGQ